MRTQDHEVVRPNPENNYEFSGDSSNFQFLSIYLRYRSNCIHHTGQRSLTVIEIRQPTHINVFIKTANKVAGMICYQSFRSCRPYSHVCIHHSRDHSYPWHGTSLYRYPLPVLTRLETCSNIFTWRHQSPSNDMWWLLKQAGGMCLTGMLSCLWYWESRWELILITQT